MELETNKYNYGYDEYSNDIKKLYEDLNPFKDKIQLVGVFKGSLPIVTHLGNLLDVPVSIINYQSRDTHSPQNKSLTPVYPVWAVNNITKDRSIVLIDDIYDSGKTYDMLKEFLNLEHHKKKIDISNMLCYTLFSSKKIPGVVSLNETLDRWIIFPWERL
jgi:hypoxanthine phosphoribosyltransferase